LLQVPYDAQNIVDGKKAAKRELQHRLGLREADRPMVGIITRLTAQKGVDLIKHGLWRALERGAQVMLFPKHSFPGTATVVTVRTTIFTKSPLV
jgi:starch synthase